MTSIRSGGSCQNQPHWYIQTKFAHKYYDEIGLGLDFTARDLQSELKAKGLPWEKAKSFDGAAYIGQWFDKSQFSNLNDLHFQLTKNNEVVQNDTTANMIWGIDEIISYVSRYFTLKIGDILFTGTPSGVGRVQSGDELTGQLAGQHAFTLNIK